MSENHKANTIRVNTNMGNTTKCDSRPKIPADMSLLDEHNLSRTQTSTQTPAFVARHWRTLKQKPWTICMLVNVCFSNWNLNNWVWKDFLKSQNMRNNSALTSGLRFNNKKSRILLHINSTTNFEKKVKTFRMRFFDRVPKVWNPFCIQTLFCGGTYEMYFSKMYSWNFTLWMRGE